MSGCLEILTKVQTGKRRLACRISVEKQFMCKEDGREFLQFVTEQLDESIRKLDEEIREGQRDIDQMHEYYWENYTEMDEYGYENYDNLQALLQSVNANEDTRRRLVRYLKMRQNPFFGRVDFRFEGDDQPEIFYIGIGNYAKEAGQYPLIFDWRAPVSGLFYDFDKGQAWYEAPMGRMNGEILSKWQYKIRGGRMIYGFESDVKIDDEILKEELGSAGSDKLKTIIRTIQKEQNAIIRNTRDRILVIQGAAGSGKTSIALHRIAYLLYHDRKNLKSSNILILSPNGIFADYISQILPELGEENIREMTLDLFAYHELQDTAGDCEDRIDLLEKELAGLVTPGEQADIAYRQTREYAGRIEGFVMCLEDELMNFSPLSYRGCVMSVNEILDLFYNRFSGIPLLDRMDAVQERFIDEWETLRDASIPDEDKEMLRQTCQAMYETTDLYEIYTRFLSSCGLPRLPADLPLKERILEYRDVYPLLYLKYRLREPARDNTVRHLVIDEMQDYSWMQFAILSRLFHGRMTILGDRDQTMNAQKNDAYGFLPEIFGKQIRRIRLNRSYRNTMEIGSYANAMAGIKDQDLVERHGKSVDERTFRDIHEAAAAAAALVTDTLGRSGPFETAAVICLIQADADRVYRELKSLLKDGKEEQRLRLNLLNRDSSSFHRGLTVTTFYLAKGLEFDEVFILFPDRQAGNEAAASLLIQAKYIAATRAMHLLHSWSFACDNA